MASTLGRSTLVLVAALLPAVLPAAPASSTITAVTVYQDRAVVTRTASVDLPAGDQQVSFEKLPSNLDDSSLHVTGSASAKATLGDVTATLVFPERTADERVRAVQDELKAEEKQLRTLSDRVAALEKERALVTRMADSAALPAPAKDGTVQARMQPAEMQQLLDFYGPALVKLAEEAQKLDDERDPLKDKIAATTAQLNELGNRQYQSSKTVVVKVSMAAAGRLDLALTYALSGAQWRPTYEARLTSADHHLSLGYYGLVTQSTGEDWKGVELTLSTAHPSTGGNPPELSPWYVDQQAVVQNFFSKGEAKKSFSGELRLRAPQARSAALMDAAASEPGSAVLESAAVTAGLTSATFRIPGSADVPSDGASHKETVALIPLDAALSYETTPKALPAVFLSAALTNSSDYPILRGAMAVFLDDTFVANAHIATVMPTEKFNLALGVDDGIAVERKVLNRFTEDLGILTKKSRVTYDLLIKVANHRQTAVKLVVHDQVPVAKYEKIEVEQLDPSPDKVKPDAQGMLTWTLNLAPGEKQEIPLKFSVTYPTDLMVTGLE